MFNGWTDRRRDRRNPAKNPTGVIVLPITIIIWARSTTLASSLREQSRVLPGWIKTSLSRRIFIR